MQRDRQTENSNSKTLMLKDSSIRSIRTYLTGSRMTETETDTETDAESASPRIGEGTMASTDKNALASPKMSISATRASLWLTDSKRTTCY